MNNLLYIFLIWVIGFGTVSILIKNKISALFIDKMKLPVVVNFILLSLPFILVEESLTCETGFPACLAVTLPALIFHILIFYFFIKFIHLPLWWSVLLYGVWGTIGEFLINGKIYSALSLGLPTTIVLLLLNTLIYMVLIIVPNNYLLEQRRRKVSISSK